MTPPALIDPPPVDRLRRVACLVCETHFNAVDLTCPVCGSDTWALVPHAPPVQAARPTRGDAMTASSSWSRGLAVLATWLSLAVPLAAQTTSPCETPQSGVTVNPTHIYIASPDHSTYQLQATTSFLIDGYRLDFLPGMGTSISVTTTRAQWTARTPKADGTPCVEYTAAATAIASLTKNTQYVLKVIALSSAGGDSAVSEPSLPFGVPGAPRPPAPVVTR